MQKLIMSCNTTRDIESRQLANGTLVANVGVASSRKFKGKNGEQKEEVMFIDLAFWGRTAEIALQYVGRGSKILIEGRLIFQQWTDNNGNKRSKHSVTVESLELLNCKPVNGQAQQGGHNNNPPQPQVNPNQGGYNQGGYNQAQAQQAQPQIQAQQAQPQPQAQQQQPKNYNPQPLNGQVQGEIDIDEQDIPF
jgi:single-strand DNA-binding protein